MNSTLLKLDWTVDDFAKCKSPGDRLESDFFEPKNDNLIYLKMHPNGFLDSQHDVYIIVYFHYCKFPEMNVLYKFSLIDNQGKPMYTRESKGIYRENSEYGFPEYICRYYITEKANELLVDGKLRIYCEYGFEILKCQCEQWICSQLENDQTQSHVLSIVDLLLMADMQSAEKLKIESIKYIVKNSNLVTSAGKLAKLMQTKPELFNKVFNLMAQKLNDLDVLDNLKIK